MLFLVFTSFLSYLSLFFIDLLAVCFISPSTLVTYQHSKLIIDNSWHAPT